MSQTFDPEFFFKHLPLPQSTLNRLTFCSAKGSKIAEWADDIYSTQSTQMGVVLYKALPEITQLQTSAKIRFELLQALWPYVQNCIEGLTASFLHQPIVMPPEAQKLAIIAQALQKNMIDGYCLCARDISAQKKLKDPQLDMLGQSLNKAIYAIGLLFLRSYQLYTQTPPRLWHTLHGLFRVARRFELLDNIDATEDGACPLSNRHAYYQVLLLSISKSNQLNQKDVEFVYKATGAWCEKVSEAEKGDNAVSSSFIVDLDSDAPPFFKNNTGGTLPLHPLRLDLSVINRELSTIAESPGTNTAKYTSLFIPDDFPSSLFTHLHSCWAKPPLRMEERQDVQENTTLCVGFSDCHYYLNGQENFAAFLAHCGLADDADSSPHSASDNIDRSVYTVLIQNRSSGGYCLMWKGEVPQRLEAGALLAMKHQVHNTWSLGIVRWVRQLRQASQFGVKILSNTPKACAAAKADGDGLGEFKRAFLFAGEDEDLEPPTLLTSSSPYEIYDEVQLATQEGKSAIKLDECQFSTSAVKQFAFHQIN